MSTVATMTHGHFAAESHSAPHEDRFRHPDRGRWAEWSGAGFGAGFFNVIALALALAIDLLLTANCQLSVLPSGFCHLSFCHLLSTLCQLKKDGFAVVSPISGLTTMSK